MAWHYLIVGQHLSFAVGIVKLDNAVPLLHVLALADGKARSIPSHLLVQCIVIVLHPFEFRSSLLRTIAAAFDASLRHFYVEAYNPSSPSCSFLWTKDSSFMVLNP
jgi:hypothetical protein